MGKRRKGKGKRSKRQAITRRDLGKKRERREGRDEEAANAAAEAGDDADERDEERDSEAPDSDDADAPDSNASDSEAPDSDGGDSEAPDSDDADDAPDSDDSDDADDDDGPLGHPDGAAWAEPLLRLERRWTWIETRVLFAALVALTFVLCLWISLRGMKEPLEAEVAAGTIFRAIVGASVLGGIARFATRGRLDDRQRAIATVLAVVVGLATAKLWRGVGIEYFSGLFDWLQEGSAFTLMGGLKGISTRLTMAVALIGGSLAAGSGTHINIDVVLRLVPARLRKSVTILGGVATAMVCIMVSWGLVDHIAVAEYKVDKDLPAGEKISLVTHHVGEQFFIWRKQVGLDLSTMPGVLVGHRWNADDRMSGAEWNEFLDGGGFVERYGKEKIDAIRAPESDLAEPWTPFVVVPDGEARGILLHGMDFIFPFGFLMIGLRFLLRALLVVAGHIQVKLEGGDDDDTDESDSDDAAAEGVA